MASSRDAAINVEGQAELRKALAAIDRGFGREINQAIKHGLEKTVPVAAGLAPHKTGRLAASLKAGAAGNRSFIRSRLPYANVIHWGGNVPNQRSTSTRPKRHFEASLFAERAISSRAEQIVDEVGDQLDRLATRHGFK